MKNKYEQIMDRVEVTPEMKNRVLSNIQDQMSKETPKKKIIPFMSWRRYSSIAAVLALVMIGAFSIQNLIKTQKTTNPSTNIETTITAPTEVASLEELSQKVGFAVEEIKNLPFTSTQTTYMAYSDGAEITYQNDSQQIVYTKNTEIGGNNGHFEEYAKEKTVDVGKVKVTLKGSQKGYQIASWDDGTYGYMIYSDVELDEEKLITMISK